MPDTPAPIDLYWSFRSPYSYLALKPIKALAERRNVHFNVKIVLPLAIRDPEFFDSRGLVWRSYLLRDVVRIAEMTGQTIAWPVPDPVVQDLIEGSIAKDQPHIWPLSRLGLLACDAGQGLNFIDAVSQLIWSGEDWTAGTALDDVVSPLGLDLKTMRDTAAQDSAALDARLAENDAALRTAGHWGVPTCVLQGEPFFGMDRLDTLDWRLGQLGIE